MLPTRHTLFLALLFGLLPLAAQAQAPNAWINELHYDNTGSDTDEFVEIVIEDASNFTLSNFQVLHYNGADGDSDAAAPATVDEFTAGATSNGFSLYSYNYTDNGETLQNSTEALALCFDSDNDGTFETLLTSNGVDQFLSYEGTLTGTAGDGCAGGETSTEIGSDESSVPPPGESVQLDGSGGSYGDFTWTGPITNTKGNVNTNQTLSSSVTITVDDDGPSDYDSIQPAIDDASSGDVIEVLEGTYTEDVTVNKDVTLEGPNVGTPGDGSRSSEATIEGQVVISASDAVFDGFDVSPPDFSNNTSEGEAVRVSNSPDNVVVRNNVVRDFEDGSSATSFFDASAINAFGGSASDPVENVDVVDNKVERVARDLAGAGAVGIAIQGNVDGANVTGNVIQDVGQERSNYALAIVVRSTGNHGEDPQNVSVTDNEVTNILPDPNGLDGVGFEFEPDNANPVTVANNDFSNTTLQVEDKTGALDIDALLANNTYDRAVVVRTNPIAVPNIYSSIQDAIDDASAGQTVDVAAGTYPEYITVNKELTIEGPYAGADPGGSLDRGNEAVVIPPFEDLSNGVLITATADNVTIDGLTLNGDNPSKSLQSAGKASTREVEVQMDDLPSPSSSVSSSKTATKASPDIDASSAVYNDETAGSITVQNNIIRNLNNWGVILGGDTDNHLIENNRFDNLPDQPSNFGRAVILFNNSYAKVLSNVISNVEVGVYTQNFSKSSSGIGFIQINENEISDALLAGIWHNLQYQDASNAFFVNNVISDSGYGLYMTSISNDVDRASAISNEISNSVYGVGAWNIPTSGRVDITDGKLDGNDTGIRFFNCSNAFGAGSTGTLTVKEGVDITNSTNHGIWVESVGTCDADDNPDLNAAGNSLFLNLSGSLIQGNGSNGVFFDGPFSSTASSEPAESNCITGNGTGARNPEGPTATFIGNYWGASDGPSGNFNGSGDAAVGNVTVNFSEVKVGACPQDAECDVPTLGEDQIDRENRTLSNTMQDDEGVAEFTFTTLDNFTVDASSLPSGYTNTSGNTWEWTDDSSPPTSVDFTLEAGDGNSSTYFLKVTDACEDPGPRTSEFDPAYEFGPAASRTQFAGNAPNPFSGQTTIEFALAEQSRVTVAVYDMMGRKVATLVDGVRSAGPHSVSWNGQSDSGQDLASGVYLLRMRAEGESETKRMTIIR